MSIVGTLLPEQVNFFAENRDLADVIDWAGEFYKPFHIYINGQYVRSKEDADIYDVAELGEELDEQNPGARIVILDNLGQIAHTIHGKVSTPGRFHLIYAIESRDCVGLWEFFESTRSDLVNIDDSGASVMTISAGELANTIFDDEDFFINNAPHQRGLHTALREYILNLQQIAKLYPLLEIKIYRN